MSKINELLKAFNFQEEDDDQPEKDNEESKFDQLKSKLAAKGAKSPGGLAAWIGRRKLGKAKFQAKAAAGKK